MNTSNLRKFRPALLPLSILAGAATIAVSILITHRYTLSPVGIDSVPSQRTYQSEVAKLDQLTGELMFCRRTFVNVQTFTTCDIIDQRQ